MKFVTTHGTEHHLHMYVHRYNSMYVFEKISFQMNKSKLGNRLGYVDYFVHFITSGFKLGSQGAGAKTLYIYIFQQSACTYNK
jgi:hypothetical protein